MKFLNYQYIFVYTTFWVRTNWILHDSHLFTYPLTTLDMYVVTATVICQSKSFIFKLYLLLHMDTTFNNWTLTCFRWENTNDPLNSYVVLRKNCQFLNTNDFFLQNNVNRWRVKSFKMESPCKSHSQLFKLELNSKYLIICSR